MFALLGVLALTSCEQSSELAQKGIKGTRIAVTAQAQEDAATRTSLNGFATEWVAGDKIGVYSPQSEASNSALTAASSAATSTFDGELFWGTGAHSFYAYYPYNDGTFDYTAVPISLPATQTQSAGGNSDHLATLDFMVARPLTGIESGGSVQLTFDHAFTLLEFRVVGTGSLSSIELEAPSGTRLAFSGGTIDLSQVQSTGDVAYEISGGTASTAVTLNLNSPVDLTEDKKTTPALYMMVNPSDLSGSEISVTATIDDEEKTITADGFTISHGRKYILVVDPNKGIEEEINLLTTEYIPDPVFLAYCQEQMVSWDENGDGKLSPTEAAQVTSIDVLVESVFDYDAQELVVNGEQIASLVGIEYFIGLTSLDCVFNQLTSLDVSKNTALEVLYCHYNQLTSLDVSKNTALKVLYCQHNQLTSLDVSKNTALARLECHYNQLTSLDISQNRALGVLFCYDNPGDGVSIFPIRAWFDDNSANSIPIVVPTSVWEYNDKTITISYYTGD
ncbi:MAG: fimbrillin family protein, partial [Prevotellaceae bacterium]|jgi:Leucine-rich repeat (LRR) protein|nr:fimbrillin family protein [Prevotellaceae bacterium]